MAENLWVLAIPVAVLVALWWEPGDRTVLGGAIAEWETPTRPRRSDRVCSGRERLGE